MGWVKQTPCLCLERGNKPSGVWITFPSKVPQLWLSGFSKSEGEKICRNTPFCQPFGFQIGFMQRMAVGHAEHGAPGEGIYLHGVSPAGQHIMTITVNYLLIPRSVTDLSTAFGAYSW